METVIDWSKAPEGFPLWLEGTNEEHRKHSGWYRDAGQVFEGAYGGQWRACREGQFFTVYRNPGPLPWTGEGLPPVGTVCESMWNESRDEWFKAKVFGVNEHGQPIFRWEEGPKKYEYKASPMSGLRGKPYFRPIRTPEQIAADEREAKAKAMYLSIYYGESVASWDSRPDPQRETFRKAIDAGWQQVLS